MTLVWGCRTFPLYDVRNVYIALQLPLDGFAALFVIDWLKNILTKSILCLLAFTPLWFTYFAKQKHSYSIIVTICFGIFAWGLISFSMDVPLKEYYRVFTNTEEEKKFLETSAFWDSNFVDIDTDSISSFDKRNLILIFMESMENTFSDSSSGGIQTSNLIPYLTNLANNNISFSNTSLLGGGRNIYGSTNTLKSSICKITGLPVINEAIRRTVVFPNVVSLYDFLKKNGYTNWFIQGTDAKFAGMEDFLNNHSIDSLLDLRVLKEKSDMSSKWRNFRTFSAGLTDKRVFDISKHLLDSLSKKEPFSLSIVTIETHFPYGLYDDNCAIKPIDDSEESLFRASLQCADLNVKEFIEDLKRKSFFENTTIVIVGDHLFMGSYLVGTEKINRRWINIFLNSAIDPYHKTNREFSSVDMAPSIIESLGFRLSKHRMGFGVSLFSEEKTLLERYNYDTLYEEFFRLRNAKQYYEKLFNEKNATKNSIFP